MRVWVSIALLLISAIFSSDAFAQDAADLCATPGNVLKNCRFEGYHSFYFDSLSLGGRVANNWNAFVISGRPDFTDVGCDSPECPDQRIWSDGQTWDAGIYQQVNVTPGQGFRARVGWFTPRCPQAGTVGRIGIDPAGGSDPRAPSIVWNSWIQLQKSNQFGIHQISAAAQSGTVTVFIQAQIGTNCTLREANGTPITGNIVWIDAAILVPDGSVAPAPTFTPTSAPPAATSTPTSTPLIAPTATRPTATRTSTPVPPTRTASATNTTSATAKPVNTSTPAATATRAPTATDSPAALAATIRRVTATPGEPQSVAFASAETEATNALTFGLLGASGCLFMLSLVLGGAALRFWRNR